MSRATLAVETWGRIVLFSETHLLMYFVSLATSALGSRLSGVVNGCE
jgi:hypothetical protein